ncbi:MAG: radical SAM protein [Prevotellaceae bacterium]|jgi:DNA repair photolyase|nr:radical SAM protein [Prevotellaceae bacterium]
MELIPAKTILQKSAYGNSWFGIDYNMNLYKGCPHGCIYCDSRSSCYQVDNFDTVRTKKDVLEILEKELQAKRKKGIVGIGAMSDAYNPFERKYEITRKALTLIKKYRFGVSIETKSDLIVRDVDVLKEVSKLQGAILKLTVTTSDDNLSKIIEPNVCASSFRFRAMKRLSDSGLFVGTLLTPMIPFITDTEENIRQVVRLSHENGAKFVWSMGGVTLRDNQRLYFYSKLDRHFEGLKNKYIKTFGSSYVCNPLNKNITAVFKEECEKYGLLYAMPDIIRAYKKTGTGFEQLKLL